MSNRDLSRFDALDVWVDDPVFNPGVAIRISDEGAEYIAAVMREEFARTADAGAFSIAEAIEKGLKGSAS